MENLSIPESRLIEQSVLSTFLMNEAAYIKYGHMVLPEYFYTEAHRKIFELLPEIRSPRLLREKNPGLAETTSALVAAYSPSTQTATEIEILADKYRRRRIIEISTQAIQAATVDYERSAADISDATISGLSEQQISTGKPEHIRDILPAVFTSLQNRVGSTYDIATGISEVDKVFGGFAPKELSIIAARPSMGKTSFVLHIIRHISIERKLPTLLFSLEMGAEQVAGRILFSDSRASYSAALLGNKGELEKVGGGVERVSGADIYIDDAPGQMLSTIASKAEFYVKNHGIRAIFIDHLGYIRVSRGRSRHEEISEISKGFAYLAKKLNVPVILVSQLSREVERRRPAVPLLSDLRESGSLEEDARKVILLYREDYYNRDTDKKGHVDVIIAKNHNGETGPVAIYGDKATMTFHPIDKRNSGGYADNF